MEGTCELASTVYKKNVILPLGGQEMQIHQHSQSAQGSDPSIMYVLLIALKMIREKPALRPL